MQARAASGRAAVASAAAPAAAIAALTRAQQSGNVQLANLQLAEWPAAVFDASLMPDKDKWWEAHPLVKLDASGNALTAVPDEIAVLKDIAVLILQHNQLQYVSGQIGELSVLQTLDLSK